MKQRSESRSSKPTHLRIIGGHLRGSRFLYHGDEVTRPMKDRVREAVFNLVGPAIKGSYIIDLFSGTGALALEGISRGASSALAIERHFPTARVIGENAKNLGISDAVEVFAGDTFIWAQTRGSLSPLPWTVFCCPPYALYEERFEDLTEMLTQLVADAPPRSRFLVESDRRLNWQSMPYAEAWNVRHYDPAFVGMFEKAESSDAVEP